MAQPGQQCSAYLVARESPVITAEAAQRFRETARRYGYWNATPEENAEVGLTLPPLH